MTALMLVPSTASVWGWLVLAMAAVLVSAALLCGWDGLVGWVTRRRAEAAEFEADMQAQRDLPVRITADAGDYAQSMALAGAAADGMRARLAAANRDTGSPYCGRLDPHSPHTWLGRNTEPSTPTIPRDCPGRPVIEGGNPAATRWPR